MNNRIESGSKPYAPAVGLVDAIANRNVTPEHVAAVQQIAARYPGKKFESLIAVLASYAGHDQTPPGCAVRKGDVLRATPLISGDPLFGGSEIVILGAIDGTIVGTSFQPEHKGLFFRGTWGASQIGDELAAGAWTKATPIVGHLEGYVLELIQRTSTSP